MSEHVDSFVVRFNVSQLFFFLSQCLGVPFFITVTLWSFELYRVTSNNMVVLQVVLIANMMKKLAWEAEILLICGLK